MVTDNDAAQFANLTAENISGFSERENPRAPTKQSPAPTVSIALTFLDLKYFLFPFSYAITPESPRVKQHLHAREYLMRKNSYQ